MVYRTHMATDIHTTRTKRKARALKQLSSLVTGLALGLGVLMGSAAAGEKFTLLKNVPAQELSQTEMAQVEGKNYYSYWNLLSPYYGTNTGAPISPYPSTLNSFHGLTGPARQINTIMNLGGYRVGPAGNAAVISGANSMAALGWRIAIGR